MHKWLTLPETLPAHKVAAITIAGILLVGVIDYVTGTQIRVFTLYLLPIIFCAWYLPQTAALLAALFATLVWIVQLYTQEPFHAIHIWMVNILTQGSCFAIVGLLIVELHRRIDHEQELARTDSLTGLMNSRAFYEQANKLTALCHRQSRPVTIAFIDLDNFKQVNDQLGHDHGDELLQRIAGLLTKTVRQSDIAARVGGDEFVVLLPDTAESAARPVLQRLRDVIANDELARRIGVTASIGAAAYRSAPIDVQRMLSKADNLMYRAKDTGKNRLYMEELLDPL